VPTKLRSSFLEEDRRTKWTDNTKDKIIIQKETKIQSVVREMLVRSSVTQLLTRDTRFTSKVFLKSFRGHQAGLVTQSSGAFFSTILRSSTRSSNQQPQPQTQSLFGLARSQQTIDSAFGSSLNLVFQRSMSTKSGHYKVKEEGQKDTKEYRVYVCDAQGSSLVHLQPNKANV